MKQQKLFVILLILTLVYFIPAQTAAELTTQKTISATGHIQYPTTYTLSITTSTPNIMFTINNIQKTTPYAETLEEGTYTIELPLSITIDGEQYNFNHWDNGSTNPLRTINLASNTAITANYIFTPSNGTLTINAYLDGTEIIAPYEVVGVTTGNTPDQLEIVPGTFTVKVTHALGVQTKTVEVLETQTVGLDFEFNTPPEPEAGTYFGWSSYPRTQSGTYTTNAIDQIIQTMDENGLNIYRMAFNDFRDIDTVVIPYVQYFIDHCNYDIIIDFYHQYPMAELTSTQLSEVISRGLAIAEHFNNNPRIILEPVNERTNTNLPSQIQTFIDEIRDAGYTYRICVNKWEHSWDSFATINDPLDRFYTGYHYYFNSGAWSSAESQMTSALNLGLKLINTEIGADYNEYSQFSQSEVDRVNEFCNWCEARGIGNTIWMCYGEGNLPTYINLGLRNPLTGSLIE